MLVIYLKLAALVFGLLAFLTLAGLGPASHLAVPRRVRWAMAPVLGLAVAICALTTAVWVMPGKTAAWAVLLPGTLLLAWWAWRRRAHLVPGARRPAGLAAAELLGIAAFVFVLFGFAPAIQHSLGPAGYQIYDGPNYVGVEVSMRDHAVFDETWGAPWDLTLGVGAAFIGAGFQQVGFSGAAAVIDAGLGLNPALTQVPFMLALVLVGALGAYGVVSVSLGRRWRPAAVVAALLYAGPVPYQLVLDGSESAIAGLALMLPGAWLAWEALRGGRRSQVVLFGLLSAGIQAAYPILFPGFAAGCGLMALVYFGAHWRRRRRATPAEGDAPRAGESTADLFRRLVPGVFGAAVLTGVLAPTAFARNLTYWKELATGGQSTVGLPTFDLPLPVIPGWLLGTREFYFLPHTSDVSVEQWLLADVIPLGLLALIVFAAFTRRSMVPFLLLALVTLAVALKVDAGGCSYCVSRSLLPFAGLLAVSVAAGIATVARLGAPWAKPAAWTLTVATLGVVFHADSVLARRGAHGAFFYADSVHKLISGLDSEPAPILVEGFDGSRDAGAELPATLHSARFHSDRKLSVVREGDEFAALTYLGGEQPSGPTLDPGYRTVLSRLGTVETDRETVREVDDVAIQRRVTPFDVTVYTGFGVNRVQAKDRRPYVHGPLGFAITGPAQGAAALSVEIEDLRRASVGKLPRGSRIERVDSGTLRICVPTTSGVIRRILLPLTPDPVAYAQPKWWEYRPVATGGAVLKSMRVVPECSVPGR